MCILTLLPPPVGMGNAMIRIYMHIIGIPSFHRDQKTRARVRELRDLQARASGLLGQKMREINNNICIYVLLQKNLISVFNIRERDFHVFGELQKRNMGFI